MCVKLTVCRFVRQASSINVEMTAKLGCCQHYRAQILVDRISCVSFSLRFGFVLFTFQEQVLVDGDAVLFVSQSFCMAISTFEGICFVR